jgi:hypothetical protein
MRLWFSFLLEVSSPRLDEAQPLLQPKLHVVLVPARFRYYYEIIDDLDMVLVSQAALDPALL